METMTTIKCPHCGDMWEQNDWTLVFGNYVKDTDCHRCGGIYTVHGNWVNMFR